MRGSTAGHGACLCGRSLARSCSNVDLQMWFGYLGCDLGHAAGRRHFVQDDDLMLAVRVLSQVDDGILRALLCSLLDLALCFYARRAS